MIWMEHFIIGIYSLMNITDCWNEMGFSIILFSWGQPCLHKEVNKMESIFVVVLSSVFWTLKLEAKNHMVISQQKIFNDLLMTLGLLQFCWKQIIGNLLPSKGIYYPFIKDIIFLIKTTIVLITFGWCPRDLSMVGQYI